MHKRLPLAAAALASLLLMSPPHAAEVIAEFSGDRDGRTASFSTDGPWLLTWRINSDFRMQQAFQLHLIDADSGFMDSRILRTFRPGNGLKLFRQEGRFQFEVSSNFTNWYLTVEQLTEEEAEQYKPTGGGD